MVTDVQQIPPIARGFPYALQIKVTGDAPMFPVGCALKADVRSYLKNPEAAGSLSTGAGTLTRISDDTVELLLAGSITAKLSNNVAVLDLVRTDVDPDEWIGIQVTLPVVQPVTAP